MSEVGAVASSAGPEIRSPVLWAASRAEAIRISDALNVDISPDGTAYGFELLNANDQLQASDDGALVVINEAIGERREIRLIG
jgi:uncharacterized protein YuzE